MKLQATDYSCFDEVTIGCLESVEWSAGMEWWNGTLEWNSKIVPSII